MGALYLEHTTREGDRWDLLALEFYGSALDFSRLLSANPDHARLPVLPAGLRLRVPILEAGAAVSLASLPPWKR